MRIITVVALAAVVSVAAAGSGAAQDATKGQSVFNQCKACHMLEKALIGPPLKGVIGRKAGSVPGFSYSPLMKAASDAGLTWSEAEITDYLKNPTTYLKNYVTSHNATATGSSKMAFMLANDDQRKNVVSYLATQK